MPAPSASHHPTAARSITGLVLAGGQGRRMGTVDKGLVPLAGRPMVAHVLERLAPQVDDILINANQHTDQYAAFGHRVIPDAIGGFAEIGRASCRERV